MYPLFICLYKMLLLVEICCMLVYVWLLRLLNYVIPCPQKSRRLLTFGDDVSTSPVKSDAILVPQSIKDIVYDVNSAPLVNFHHYERLQQEVSYKVDVFFFVFTISPTKMYRFCNLNSLSFWLCLIVLVKVGG